MEILGFVFSFAVLGYLSFCLVVIGLYGGFELGFIGLKNLWWYMPMVGVIGYLWYWLFQYSPFGLTIN